MSARTGVTLGIVAAFTLAPGVKAADSSVPSIIIPESIKVSFDAPPPETPTTSIAERPVGSSISVPADDPSAPNLWSAEFSIHPDSVGIRWKPFPGAVRYFVVVAADPNRQQPLWMTTTDQPEVTVPLGGFVPRGPVFVKFQAVNAQAEEISSFITSSVLGRQTDLPSGIKGIRIRTLEVPVAPTPAPPRPHGLKWQPTLYSRDLTVISGQFGQESYNTYLVSHGFNWFGDGPTASVSASARLQYANNDRLGLSLGHGDANLSSSVAVALKNTPLQVYFNNYLYQSVVGGSTRNINNLGMDYRVNSRLTTGAQITPHPNYMTAWGSYQLSGNGSVMLQLLESQFAHSVTLSYHTSGVFR